MWSSSIRNVSFSFAECFFQAAYKRRFKEWMRKKGDKQEKDFCYPYWWSIATLLRWVRKRECSLSFQESSTSFARTFSFKNKYFFVCTDLDNFLRLFLHDTKNRRLARKVPERRVLRESFKALLTKSRSYAHQKPTQHSKVKTTVLPHVHMSWHDMKVSERHKVAVVSASCKLGRLCTRESGKPKSENVNKACQVSCAVWRQSNLCRDANISHTGGFVNDWAC